ncbi:GNAT family N-acetyltransferase [Propionicicella superfundia]|uniref:GNAT family N-acetyltransferase n=1 Tax=Propionicicella superfundia TaxID=348582 RepID=UPI000404B1AE|nr:GNAT family N-acetyltransferase [Propionicicella superfundia]
MTEVGPVVAAEVAQVVALDALAPRGWSRTSWEAQVSAENTLTLACRDGGRPGILGVAAFSLAADVADLLRVAVAPEHRRRGIARALVAEGIAWAESLEATRMLLEVEPGNEAAVALYEGFGFAPIGVRTDYYGAGADAVVMERPLGGGQQGNRGADDE